jgi:hypothetical protein
VWAAIKQHVPEDHLSKFKFSNTDFEHLHWLNAHEFEFQENLYDIVRMTTGSDSVIVVCINDLEEKTLKKNIEKEVDNDIGHTRNTKKFKKTFDIQCESLNTITISSTHESTLISLSLKPYANHYKTILDLKQSPPPKTV